MKTYIVMAPGTRFYLVLHGHDWAWSANEDLAQRFSSVSVDRIRKTLAKTLSGVFDLIPVQK